MTACEMCPSKVKVKEVEVSGARVSLCPRCTALVLEPEPVTTDKNAPRGTFLAAALVSPYFRIEQYGNDSKSNQRPTEARPSRPLRLQKVRRRLRDFEASIGTFHPGLEGRPGAGERITGPLALPGRREPRPLPSKTFPPRTDFVLPDEAIIRDWSNWYFRTGLHRRSPEAASWILWPMVGLVEPDGQEG